MSWIKRGGLGLLIAWVVGGFGVFLSGIFIHVTGAPQSLPLPWSDFQDFVVTSDGSLWVALGFYDRLLQYDAQGQFVGSYPVRFLSKSPPCLAVSENGSLYVRGQRELLCYDLHGAPQVGYPGKDALNSWILRDDGIPECREVRGPQPERPVRPGEALFLLERAAKTVFRAEDGSVTTRSGNTLLRVWPDGRRTTYRTEWYLRWAVFPLPLVVLVWPAFFFLAWLDNRSRTRRGK